MGDLAGVLLEQWSATLPEACCAACAEKEMCQGFAFIGDQCYLKGEVQGTYEHQGCVTNVKSGRSFPTSGSGIAVQGRSILQGRFLTSGSGIAEQGRFCRRFLTSGSELWHSRA